MGLFSRLLAALATSPNWRCSRCDTWNDDTDLICHCCYTARPA